MQPYRDPSLPIDQRIADLLSRMTLTEKIGQLNQVPAADSDLEGLKAQIREGRVGAFVMASTAYAGNEQQRVARVEQLNELQKVAVEETRLGIPILNGRDVIHGCNTVFPIPLGLAAAWDPELVRQCSEVAAREARAIGAHWTFAPMLDIARDPRWGRIAEGFGEDPYLCGQMAAAAVCGFQNGRAGESILACAKHFVAYGAAEAGKDYNTAECTDNTLLNVYAAPFAAAIRAGVATVMSSFNELGGEPVVGSRRLMVDLLRHKLGFEGMTVTDWGSVWQLINHGVVETEEQCAAMAIRAENDLEMCSNQYIKHLQKLVESGEIAMELVDRCVGRVLRAKFQAGLFEQPYTDPAAAARVLLAPEHRQLARQAAARSAVLLKNEDALPIEAHIRSIAVLGPMADEQDSLLGTWSMDGRSSDVVSIVKALREELADIQIHHCPHLSDVMLALAKRADLVIMALGENRCRSGEDNSVASLDLPPGQKELFEAVADLDKPIVTVICAGRPLAIPTILRRSDAVLWSFHAGIGAGSGIVDVLTGKVSPGGKLPVTLPRHGGQVPIYYNHKRTGRPYSKQHLDVINAPQLPFGFGLSYTRFELRDLQLSAETIPADGQLTVSITVQNTGELSGDEVVQLYVRDEVASAARPVKELKGFTRVHLRPGEARQVSFALGRGELGFYNLEGNFVVEPGKFTLWVSTSSVGGLEGQFVVR